MKKSAVLLTSSLVLATAASQVLAQGRPGSQPADAGMGQAAGTQQRINVNDDSVDMRVMDKQMDRDQLHIDDATPSGDQIMMQNRQMLMVDEDAVNSLKQQLKNAGESTELRMANARAIAGNGATFSVDEETGEIMVTTPSGQTHILNNLPPQALDMMLNSGLLDQEASLSADTLLELVTDGDLISYKYQTYQQKKFLGLFPRNINTEIMLDDATGEVTQTMGNGGGFFSRILDALSF